MRSTSLLLPLLAFATVVVSRELRGQPALERPGNVVSGNGWEGFPNVEYVGGDATVPTKQKGMLVLTDSTVAFYKCFYSQCRANGGQYFAESDRMWSHSLRAVSDVASTARNEGPSVKGRIWFGTLATDRNAEYFSFSYEQGGTVETPVFKVGKAMGGAMEAKLKFRMKKLGVSVPPL